MAVDQLDQRIAAGDDVQVVPVAILDIGSSTRSPSPERADRADLPPFGTYANLAAQREKAAAALFVDLAGVLLLRVDIGLVALHHPFRDVRQFDAAVLNAAVAVFAPVSL